MLNTLPAVGFAAGVAHLVDFSVKILREDHAIYPGADGANPDADDHVVLRSVANHLFWLTSKVDKKELKKSIADKKNLKLSDAAQQLLRLSDDAKGLADQLIDAVFQAQSNSSFGDRHLNTVRQALLAVWKEKEIVNLSKRFRGVRKELDAAVLLALRENLDQAGEKGPPIISVEDAPMRTPHCEVWQNEALETINSNDWKPRNKQHIEAFSREIDVLAQADVEATFYERIFANLHFVEQDDRLHSINAPHDDSFKWVLDPRRKKEGSFLGWLGDTNGQNLFWVTGKPGSGKSTLMKHLYRNEDMFPWLENWSENSPGFSAGFFLWNCGTNLQKTSIGLLRCLLYEALQDMIYGDFNQNPSILRWLFSDRWRHFTSYGGGLHSFSLSELRRTFELLISDTSRKFLFLIDGLDELEDSPSTALDILLSAAKRENVKICVSSRPESTFQRAFENRPSLEIDRRTKRSILSYVLYAFDQNDTMFNLASEESDGTEERAIIMTLVEKASGVFLWASLATEYLLQTTRESDDVSKIRARVDALPSDLEHLLSYIFDNLEVKHMEQASRLISLIDAHGYPSLLPLCFATDLDTKSSVAAETRPLTTSEVLRKVEDMRNLLKFKCKNLISIFEVVPAEEDPSETIDLTCFRVNYAHRCIRDFLQSDSMDYRIYQAANQESFNTDENWANAHLWALKTLSPRDNKMQIWNVLADCIEHALRLEKATRRIRVTYLDEVFAAVGTHVATIPSSNMNFPPGATVQSFVDIALLLNLTGYLTIRAKTADRKDLRHAIEYAKEVRKRLSAGGEETWLGKRPNLKLAYAQSTQDLGLLVEYYSKSMRMSTSKPVVEVLEWV